MNEASDSERTQATNARIVREALLKVADDVKLAADYRVTAALDVVADLANDDVLLRLRGLIR